MSQIPEENKEIIEEESTIFTASPIREKKEVKKGESSKKRATAIIAAALALCIVGGAIAAVATLIPKREEVTSSQDEGSPVTPLSNAQVKQVTVKSEKGETVFKTALSTNNSSGSTSVSWSIDGINPALTESVIIASYMDTTLRMQKLREVVVDSTMDYGLDTPLYTVSVIGYNEQDNYEYVIGDKLSDGSGYYGKSADGVFVLASEDVEILAKPAEEMSIATVFPAASGSDSVYFTDGALAQFDSIEIGRKGEEKIVIEKNPNDNTVSVIGSVLSSPANRYANDDLVDKLFTLAQEGLEADYAYEYNPTAAKIASYGLSAPEFTYKIAFGEQEISFRAAVKEIGYYAVLADNNPNIIFKVPAEKLSFAEYDATDYSSSYVFLEMMSDLGEVSFTRGNKVNTFEITYFEEKDAEQDFIIKVDGRTIDPEVFISYYDYLLGIELNEISFEKLSGTPVLAVRAKYADGSATRELKFIKYSDRRYYVEADGTPVGYITGAYMEKLLNYLDLAVAGKEVPAAF